MNIVLLIACGLTPMQVPPPVPDPIQPALTRGVAAAVAGLTPETAAVASLGPTSAADLADALAAAAPHWTSGPRQVSARGDQPRPGQGAGRGGVGRTELARAGSIAHLTQTQAADLDRAARYAAAGLPAAWSQATWRGSEDVRKLVRALVSERRAARLGRETSAADADLLHWVRADRSVQAAEDRVRLESAALSAAIEGEGR